MNEIFENDEILVLNDDFHEKLIVLQKENKTYFEYDYSWSREYEDEAEGFYIELDKHNVSKETIEEFKEENE